MSKKKNKTPLALRVIPAVFPWLERLAQPLANRLFVYLFFTPINYGVPEKEKKAETFGKKFNVTIKAGKNIQCYQWGSGDKTILLVHGWAGRATQFRRFIKPLVKEGFQVVGFDGPAHGKSDGRSTDLDEFQEVIALLVKRFEKVFAIIAHSFGGVASLYAIANGLPVPTLINIASPTIGDEIIKTYLKALGGSSRTGEAFKRYVLKKSGKTFDEFSSLALVGRVPATLSLLLVHDEGDKEVSLDHPMALLNRFPQAQLHQTNGLGHTRILKDDAVIRDVVTFILHHSSKNRSH